jgi:hypothetical protein
MNVETCQTKGVAVGFMVGDCVGLAVGVIVGLEVGDAVGLRALGMRLGPADGIVLGTRLGFSDGLGLGHSCTVSTADDPVIIPAIDRMRRNFIVGRWWCGVGRRQV